LRGAERLGKFIHSFVHPNLFSPASFVPAIEGVTHLKPDSLVQPVFVFQHHSGSSLE